MQNTKNNIKKGKMFKKKLKKGKALQQRKTESNENKG